MQYPFHDLVKSAPFSEIFMTFSEISIQNSHYDCPFAGNFKYLNLHFEKYCDQFLSTLKKNFENHPNTNFVSLQNFRNTI